VSHRDPNFPDLVSPSPILLELLNEGATRGYTTFHKKGDDGQLRGIASVPVDCLPGIWEELVDDLHVDAYCSANLMFRRGHGYARPGLVDQQGNQLHKPHRDNRSLCRLNAVWVDIDSYKVGLTEGEITGQIWDAQVAGIIPPPSALQRSGRGMWAFWFLDGDNRAWDREIALWRQIMTHLVKLFRASGGDVQSTDPARICRIPGSMNRAAGRRVNVLIFAGDEGVPRYSLGELADWFGIQTDRRDIDLDPKPKKLSNRAKGTKGQALRWVHDESRFWLLVEQIRGKVSTGTRNAHCFVLGAILARRYRDLEERAAQVDRQARRLWNAFEDRREYPEPQVAREVRKAAWTACQKITHGAIAERLGITAEEALALAQLTERDPLKSWPTADGPLDIPAPLKAHDKARQRRAWIVANERFARDATKAQLAAALTSIGLDCSPNTAAKDRDIALPTPTSNSTPRSLF
jgi:hypothetical protein